VRKCWNLWLGLAVVGACLPGCAALGELRAFVQPPTFAAVSDRPAEITLEPPSTRRPLGGAAIRLWTEVGNPNPFGLTLTTLDGTLFLEGARAATASFPLGLPLGARQQSVIPLDLSISFADLPQLADAARRALGREPVVYRLDGTIGVDAGRLGQPVFGPMTLLQGDFRQSWAATDPDAQVSR
jgi:hypothetical protein